MVDVIIQEKRLFLSKIYHHDNIYFPYEPSPSLSSFSFHVDKIIPMTNKIPPKIHIMIAMSDVYDMIFALRLLSNMFETRLLTHQEWSVNCPEVHENSNYY